MGGRNPVGQVISLNGRTFRIVWVLAPKGSVKADDIDDKIVIPYSIALKIAEKKTVAEIWGKADTPIKADLAVVQLGRIFKRKLGLDQSAPTTMPSDGEEGPSDGGVDQPIESEDPPGRDSKPIIPGSEDLITITI